MQGGCISSRVTTTWLNDRHMCLLCPGARSQALPLGLQPQPALAQCLPGGVAATDEDWARMQRMTAVSERAHAEAVTLQGAQPSTMVVMPSR
eukprot:365157-Chlamydomonas_euryale.AAC.29